MPRFANPRHPTSISQLSDRQREQLQKVSPQLDGSTADPALGFTRERFRGLELWDVVDDDGVVRYEVWLHDIDAGFAFRGDGTPIGRIAQFGLTCEGDDAGWDFIAKAAAATEFGDSDAGGISWARDAG